MSRRKSLVITGDRLNGRHLIYVRGRPVWLTTSQFTTLCLLIHARITSTTGYLATSVSVEAPEGCGSSRSTISLCHRS